MLKGTTNRTLNYRSVIDDKNIVQMNATCPESGNATRNIVILDKDLYEANKEACRADIEAFEKLIYDLEDESLTTEDTMTE